MFALSASTAHAPAFASYPSHPRARARARRVASSFARQTSVPIARVRDAIARASSADESNDDASDTVTSGSSFDGFSTTPGDEDAQYIADMVTEIKDWLKLLYVKREMSFNEIKLTVGIEDPRLAENRERYGIEDESGVSADEKVETLEMIERGETPTDARAVSTLSLIHI